MRTKNEPKYLLYIIKILARIMAKDKSELINVTINNAQCFFQLDAYIESTDNAF